MLMSSYLTTFIFKCLNCYLKIFPHFVCRKCLDCKCTHYYCHYRLWSPLTGLGCGAAWLDCRSHNSCSLFGHYVVYFQSPSRLLSVPWDRKEKLHLHGSCQEQLRCSFANIYLSLVILLIWWKFSDQIKKVLGIIKLSWKKLLLLHVIYLFLTDFFFVFLKQVEKCTLLVDWCNMSTYTGW